ncbi:MAG TPA: hypothetical protein VK737_11250 [Opitutales bacterium]|nr:hypothetical protein [Opitutales bacterium]
MAQDAPKGFVSEGVDFYLSPQQTSERASLDDLATYTKALQGVCETYFANTTTAEDLDIVAAVRPGPDSRVWLISLAPPPANDRLADLRAKLDKVPPPPVNGGPVALSIHGVIANGNDKPPSKDGGPPQMPDEWKTIILQHQKTKPVSFDEMLGLVWSGPVDTGRPWLLPVIVGLVLLAGAVYATLATRKKSVSKPEKR